METRANSPFVIFVVSSLLGLLLMFVVWIAKGRDPGGIPYQIRFPESVSGLKIGSPVTLSGVKVGIVQQVAIDTKDPGVVEVRIEVRKDVTLGEGVFASLNTSLLGDATIALEGVNRGAPPLRRNADSIAMIPVRSKPLLGGTGGAASIFEKVANITETLNGDLDERGQKKIRESLQLAERQTSSWSGKVRGWQHNLARANATLKGARRSLEQYDSVAAGLSDKIGSVTNDGPGGLTAKLREADTAARNVEADLRDFRGKIGSFTEKQEVAVEVLRDSQRTLRGVRRRIEDLDQNGIQQSKLPDYNVEQP